MTRREPSSLAVVTVATVTMIVMPAVIVTVAWAWAAVPVTTMSVTFTVLRCVDIVVPAVSDKIDRTTAGIVLAAVVAPMACMLRRYAQVDRGWRIADRLLNDHGLRVQHLGRRCSAEIKLAEEARLANVDRYTDAGPERGTGGGEEGGTK